MSTKSDQEKSMFIVAYEGKDTADEGLCCKKPRRQVISAASRLNQHEQGGSRG